MAKQKHPPRRSDKLDAFLRFVVRGKYRWRRLEIFEQFLREHKKLAPETIEVLIPVLQEHGVNGKSYEDWMYQIPQWRKTLRKKKARKAAIAMWHKKLK